MRKWLAVLSFLCVSVVNAEGFVQRNAPEFKLPLLSGQGALELKSLRGKVVYVDFWASWCGPCRQSLPQMNALYAELRDQGLEIVAVNLDEEGKDGRAFLASHPVNYPVVHDPRQEMPERYGVDAMPTSFLIDRDGVIQVHHRGFRDGDLARLRTQIVALLTQGNGKTVASVASSPHGSAP